MSGGRLKFAFISLTVFACLMAASPSRADQQHHKKTPVKQPQAMPVVAPPPVPLTLQQQPASPPQVAFQNGELTITAPNSVLGEILRAVRSRTGASVDVPPNATERVVGRFGPGPARDVLASLLNGSHFNYVMLGSATNPTELDRVILIPKAGETEPAAPVSQASANASPPAPMPAGEVASAEPTMTDDEDPTAQDQSAQDDEAQDDTTAQQPVQPTNPPPGVRSPEQLLQELQRQQQQMQQQQQGGNPQPFPTPPGVQPPGMQPVQPQP